MSPHTPLVALAFLLLGPALSSAQAEFPRFEEVVIDPQICETACYAVALADVDGDRRDDIVAVTEDQVVWYQTPDWRKRIIIDGQTEPDNVCIAPRDIDGDGQIDFALGAGWTKVGTIQWLSRGAALDEKWQVHAIGEEPWTHRMRWADVLGTDRPQLVVSPLNATAGTGVRLTAFGVPDDPRTDRWPRTVLDDSLNRLHNHWHIDIGQDGVEETITASQEGVHLVHRNRSGEYALRKIGSGMPGDEPAASGAGEVKFGRLGNGRAFLATIEPMHGTSVVVYTNLVGARAGDALADRNVLDATLKQGHAVWLVNLDDDPSDEIVIGHREAGDGPVKGPGVYIYDAQDAAGTQWDKHVVDDGGMACEDLICGDLDGDGDADIVAGGRATKNLKLYLNRRR
jgi:hypothetical protein